MLSKILRPATAVTAVVAMTATAGAAAAVTTSPGGHGTTLTPIKHVVVIIGENHSFDNVFATYRPPGHQRIWNLRSEGIVTANGSLGPRAREALQLKARDTSKYSLHPKITGAYKSLPRPNTTYVSTGCDGLPANSPDTRFPAHLANGPYQITKYVPYLDSHSSYSGGCEFPGAYVGDPM